MNPPPYTSLLAQIRKMTMNPELVELNLVVSVDDNSVGIYLVDLETRLHGRRNSSCSSSVLHQALIYKLTHFLDPGRYEVRLSELNGVELLSVEIRGVVQSNLNWRKRKEIRAIFASELSRMHRDFIDKLKAFRELRRDKKLLQKFYMDLGHAAKFLLWRQSRHKLLDNVLSGHSLRTVCMTMEVAERYEEAKNARPEYSFLINYDNPWRVMSQSGLAFEIPGLFGRDILLIETPFDGVLGPMMCQALQAHFDTQLRAQLPLIMRKELRERWARDSAFIVELDQHIDPDPDLSPDTEEIDPSTLLGQNADESVATIDDASKAGEE